MKWIKFISSLVISYVLGFTLNKGLSATNTFKGIKKWTYNIPYIFTISLNEMLLIISLTTIVFLFLHCYYSKSRVSKQQLFILLVKSIWIESIIFSFIIGTLTNKVLEDLKNNNIEFFEYFSWLCVMLAFSLIISIAMYSDYLRDKSINNKYINDLYKSREELLKIMDFYLKNTNRFSIVGEWGIGKTKLITNFFKGEYFYKENNQKYYYKNKYTHIYIDASAYTNNQKIIEVLEDELNEVFKKNRIFKIGRNISRELFTSSNEYINFIRNIFFFEKTLEDSKENLNKKIEEYQVSTNKKLVLCVDNLERIADKERIISLLAIIDELFSNDVKKIYIYDDKYMEKLFGKEEFKKYIKKYSDLEIRVNKLKVEEIIEDNKILQELIKKYKKIFFDELTLNKNELNKMERKKEVIQRSINAQLSFGKNSETPREKNEKEEVILKIKELKVGDKILQDLNDKFLGLFFNPRYILGMEKFIESNYLNYSVERLFEYKIIIDLFVEFNLDNKFLRKIFFKNKSYKYRKKEEELYELHNGKIKKEEETIEGEIRRLKEKCENSNAKDLCNYLNYCIDNNILKKIKEVLKVKRIYTIDNINSFLELVDIYLDKKINVHILTRYKIKLNQNFFGRGETYSLNEALNMIKILLILSNLSEVKKIIKTIYNNKDTYIIISELFTKGGKEFEEFLKKQLNISVDELIKLVTEECIIEKNNTKLLDIIDKNRLKKEILILNNLKIEDQEKKDEIKIKLTKEIFIENFNKELKIESFLNISEDSIGINSPIVTEEINIENIEIYIKEISEIRNDSEAKKFLMEIYLLKERIEKRKLNNF